MYECHITLDPNFDREKLRNCAPTWKVSEIQGDEILGDKRFLFLTKSSPHFTQIMNDMNMTCSMIPSKYILRRKIELTVFDSKDEGVPRTAQSIALIVGSLLSTK